MSALGNILKKEIKDLLTPSTILPIVILTIIFSSLGNTIGVIEEEIGEKPVIGLINQQNATFSYVASEILHKYANVVYNSTDISDKNIALEQVKDQDGIALVIIPSNFSTNIENSQQGYLEIYWVMKGAGIMDAVSSASLEGQIAAVRTSISKKLVEKNTTADVDIVLTPTNRIETTYLKGKEFNGVSPGHIANVLSSQSSTIPIVMMMIIIIAGGMVISSIAMEKENKTLETLLTLPVKRTSIVTGKIIASAVVGLLLAFIYMFGIGYYMQSFSFSDGSATASIELSLSTFDVLLVGVSLFITLVAALSLCMLLGTMAKNYKSAQTLTFPVTMMALFPMLLTMFVDFDTMPLALKAIIFAIPFSHPMMAPRALLFDDYMFVLSGMIYVLIFALIMIVIVVWVFRTDRLLTGSINNRFSAMFKRK